MGKEIAGRAKNPMKKDDEMVQEVFMSGLEKERGLKTVHARRVKREGGKLS